jgi:hypothetical protein
LKIELSSLIFKVAKMIVKQFQGLWFLYDSKEQKVYAYEKEAQNPLWLGTVDPATEQVTFRPDWKAAYEAKLQEYRSTEKPKSRIPATV